MRDTKHVSLVHDDLLRISTERVARRVRRRGVVRANHVVAVVLETDAAVLALFAAIDDAADADKVADFHARHMRTQRRCSPHDFMSRDAGVHRARPFSAHLVQIRMADTAKGDVDLYICAPTARRMIDIGSSGLSCATAPKAFTVMDRFLPGSYLRWRAKKSVSLSHGIRFTRS